MTLGVLASGEGTTLQAMLDAFGSGRLKGGVAVVISNNSDAGALRRARHAGVETRHLSSATHPDATSLDEAIRETLVRAEVDLVFLAGYMKKLGPRTLHAFEGRILNTHPSLLPKFGGPGMYGHRVFEAIVASRDTETGISIHFVDAEYDAGRVVAQCVLQVLPSESAETLASRVRAHEKAFVIDTLAGIDNGTIDLQRRLERRS